VPLVIVLIQLLLNSIFRAPGTDEHARREHGWSNASGNAMHSRPSSIGSVQLHALLFLVSISRLGK
jgi:hypothetical protein